MYKKLYLIILFSYFSFYSVNIFSNEKIAVVDIASIFQKSPKRIVVIKQLENEFKDRIKELRSMESNLQNRINHFQQEISHMEEKERNIFRNELMEERKNLSKKIEIFEKDNRRRQLEEKEKILTDIKKIVEIIAKKNGYDLVIDSDAIIYNTSKKDITKEVLKRVR